MAKFKECALPLYLKLCFQRAVRWASVSTIRGTPVLPPEILLEDADGQGCFVLPLDVEGQGGAKQRTPSTHRPISGCSMRGTLQLPSRFLLTCALFLFLTLTPSSDSGTPMTHHYHTPL